MSKPTAKDIVPLLTYDDAADILQVKYETVSRLVCAGEIEVVEVGKQTKRIHPKALEAFIERKTSSRVPSGVRLEPEKVIKRRLLSYTVRSLKPLKEKSNAASSKRVQ
jgi:excisionase family DNA binding protein